MKILLVNTFHYLRGGDCTYTFNLAELLRGHGHEVHFFAMHHPQNLACGDSRFFVDHIDFVEMLRQGGVRNGIRVVARAIHSGDARRRIAAQLDELKPDIVHLQNIHGHITPSVIFEIQRRKIPVVWTLHDFKMVCPNTHLLSHGEVCEACKRGVFFQCTLKRCKKGSLGASVVASIEAYVHEAQDIAGRVDHFIAPSLFMVDKLREFGWHKRPLMHLRNFLLPQNLAETETSDRGYALYLGRLSPEKGVHTLLLAADLNPSLLVRVVGDGPQRAALESLAKQLKMQNVVFDGHRGGPELQRLLRESSFVIVPSEWYENCPYSVMEALAAGKPVVASRMGGLPELVEDGVTGLLCTSGDVRGFARAMRWMMAHKSERREMGRVARAKALSEFDSGRHYEALTRIYGKVGRGAQA